MKVLVSTNQFNREALEKAEKLACDGVFFVSNNTSASVSLWRKAISKIGETIITEDGAIDSNWLFGREGFNSSLLRLNFDHCCKVVKESKIKAAMVYHEWPHTFLTERETREASARIGKPIIPLFRTFNEFQSSETNLKAALSRPEVFGICLEAAPNSDTLAEYRITEAIDWVLTQSTKPVYWLISPGGVSCFSYEQRIKECLGRLEKAHRLNPKLHLVAACYERQNNDVRILGAKNSMEAAVKLLEKLR